MSSLPKGGTFLIEQNNPLNIFTPEDFTEEHKMIFRTARGFIADTVMPRMEELDAQKEGVLRELLEAAADLGLHGSDIPEEYGGMEMDKISSIIIGESFGPATSFVMAQGSQCGIGSWPIVFFGNHEQKKRYLPSIVSAEKIGAYALTEPGSGSDAVSIKTKAVLSPDGKSYILNGTKQFITNAGITDVFIVYAKVDGDKFTAFIVDGNSQGLSMGKEEKKMGIKGSSTRNLILEDCKVPVENVLFEIGRGHIVAFNILNMGRLKVSSNVLGNAKYALELSATYANERKQFNKPIAHFGLIKEKLAEMNTGIYVSESMIYRTAGMLDNLLGMLDTSGEDGGQVAANGIAEYALECSINKVFATENQGFVVDEGVQIHGGYGVVHEYPIERLYRDARVYRIFEGTNEINRTIIPNVVIRRSNSNALPLKEAIENLRQRLTVGIPVRKGEAELIQAAKDMFLWTLDAGLSKYGEGLFEHQEIVGRLADIVIQIYAMESAWLRAQKQLIKDGWREARLKLSMSKIHVNKIMGVLQLKAKEVLVAIAEGEELEKLLLSLQELCKFTPENTIALRQEVAEAVSATGKYVV